MTHSKASPDILGPQKDEAGKKVAVELLKSSAPNYDTRKSHFKNGFLARK